MKLLRMTNGMDVRVDDDSIIPEGKITLTGGIPRLVGGLAIREYVRLRQSGLYYLHLNCAVLDCTKANVVLVRAFRGLSGVYERSPGTYYAMLGGVIKGPFSSTRQAAVAYNLLNPKEQNIVEPYKPRGGIGPEAKIQAAFVDYLTIRGWYVKRVIGVKEQAGLPDLFITHKDYGSKWVDIKVAGRYRITPAQKECWPKLSANGSGVWIIVAANDTEYNKLFKPANWEFYYNG